MTVERQRKSFHWFLNVGVQRRVVSDLPGSGPNGDLQTADNNIFLPSHDQCQTLNENMAFHIVKVLVNYIDSLKPYADSVPEVIEHAHMNEMAQKSKFALLELLEKNENKTDDMISILEHVHEHYVAKTDDEFPRVVERKVFGGDVLTNERAFGAQEAMRNMKKSDYERLQGVVTRPEGLHRMMNFLVVYHVEVQVNVLLRSMVGAVHLECYNRCYLE